MEYAPPRYSGNSWINQAGPTGRFALLPVKDCKLTRRDENTVVVDIFENGDLTEWISYDDETKLRFAKEEVIYLNLSKLTGASFPLIAATLCHEMIHSYDRHFGEY